MSTEYLYGFYSGGDPRKFSPEADQCSEKDLSAHKAACKLWDEAEARGEKPTPEKCPSGWIYDDAGKVIAHVLRAPYGIGVQEYEVEDEEEPTPAPSTGSQTEAKQ